jgi:leucyl-tRNA synthetase
MAVPAHDERDFEFAKKFDLPIRYVVAKSGTGASSGSNAAGHGQDARDTEAFTDDGVAINSELINGLPTEEAKQRIIDSLEIENTGRRSIKYKLRDWLFSRQRYWGEPFPILLDEDANPHALDESELPLTLPEMADFKPTGTPEPPLTKAAAEWLRVQRDGKPYTRETNTMPQWAGSCWYYLRYCDPENPDRFVDPDKERYWMPVDLYVGGVEHAVLHLLYARFWHKVLFDLGHVSTAEPFARLVNQGLILGEMEFHAFETEAGEQVTASDARDVTEEATEEGVRLIAVHAKTGAKLIGKRVAEDQVEKTANGYRLRANANVRVDARSFKMSKSRGNVVNPDDIVKEYGADAFRLYEMYMGPLEAQKPWSTRDIVGMARFLSAVWRNLIGDEETTRASRAPRVGDAPIPEPLDRQMHRTIRKVAEDIQSLRFNTAIAELIKLNNEITGMPSVPRELAENLVLMLSPFAPHLAEELWERLGHHKTLARRPWPAYDEAKLIEAEIELPVQVNGKLRDRIRVPADADEATILQTAETSEKLKPWIEGKTVKKRLYVPRKLVNLVVG